MAGRKKLGEYSRGKNATSMVTIGVMDTMQIGFCKSANRNSSFSRLNFGRIAVNRRPVGAKVLSCQQNSQYIY